jgi:hypothetical protein
VTEGSSGIEYSPPQRPAQPVEQPAPPEQAEALPRPDLFWLVIAFAGLVLVIISFTVLHWFRGDSGSPVFLHNGSDSSLRNVHTVLDRLHAALKAAGAGKYVGFGVSRDYFSWLGWLLLVATVAAAMLALLPSRLARIFRVVVLVVALVSIGITMWAIQLFSLSGPVAVQLGHGNPGWTDFIGHAGVGFWVAIVGFLLLGAGSALAAPNQPPPPPTTSPDQQAEAVDIRP